MNLIVSLLIGLTVVGSAVVSVPNLAMEWAKWRTPEVTFYVPTEERTIALTIDDGPSEATPEILEVLKAHGAKATFFVIGENVRARPEITRSIVEAGHELGHHMLEDRPSRDLQEDVFEDRFDQVDRMLDGLGGSTVFRPGSGWYNDHMIEAADSRGYRTVLGSVYPFDAQVPATGLLSWYVLQNTVPGSILVLHDGPDRGDRTADVLRSILPDLRSRGYQILTVSELLSRSASP